LGEGVLRETRHFVEDLDSLGYMGLKTRQKRDFGIDYNPGTVTPGLPNSSLIYTNYAEGFFAHPPSFSVPEFWRFLVD
jgi:hypothetical protein